MCNIYMLGAICCEHLLFIIGVGLNLHINYH